MEDNNVYVNIKINSQDLKLGTKEVSEAVTRTAQNMVKCGKVAQASCNSAANAFMKQNQAVANTAAEVEKLTDKLAEMKTKKEATKWLNDQFKESDENLKRLNAELTEYQKALSNSNKKNGINSTQSETLKNNIAKIKEEIALEEKARKQAMNDPRAYKTVDTSAIEQKLAIAKQKHAAAVNSASLAYEKFNNVVSKNKEKTLTLADVTKKATAYLRKFDGANINVGKSMKKGITTILKYGFGLRSLYVAWRKLRSAMIEGFKTLAKETPAFNKSISGIATQLGALKNSFAAAFAPLVTIVAPIIEAVLSKINALMRAVSGLIAALTGGKTFLAAKENQVDFAKSLDKTGSAAKKASKYLSGLDEIATFTKNDSGSGSGGGTSAFETLGISEETKKLADKIKSILDRILKPLKEAWNKNEIGARILANIKDLTDIIYSHIESMARATLEWWESLDFYPLFEAINGLLESLKPVVDSLMGILEGFYTKVLLPLGTWVIEKGLPDLLNILTNLNNNIDWEKLLNAFDRLWTAIEPLAEKVGEGLLWFLENVIEPLVEWAMNDIIPPAIDLVSSAIELLGTIIDAAMPSLLTIWDNFLVPIRDYTWDKIASFIQLLSDKFKKLSDWARNNKSILEEISSVVIGFMAGLWVYNTSKNMISFLTNLIAKFVEFGGLSGMFNVLAGAINSTALALGAITAAGLFWVQNWEEIKQAFMGMTMWQQAITVVLGLAAAIAVLWVAMSAGLAAASIVAGLAALGLGAGILAMGKANSNNVQASQGAASYAMSNPRNAVRSSVPSISVGGYSIPALARGAVIPPNAPFLATLGDQRSGNNFEAPEGLLRQVVREESGSGSYHFTAQINRRTLFDEVITEAKIRQSASGRNPFEFA